MNGWDGRRMTPAGGLVAGALALAACGDSDGDATKRQARADDRAAIGHAGHAQDPAETTTGLSGRAHGHRIVAERTRFEARRAATFAFRIVDRTGRPVRRFDIEQTKRMHLIVVRRDLTGYQHLHPGMSRSGRWSVPLTLRAPGAYRAFADFVVDGRKTVVGVDLDAPGPIRPASLRTVKPLARSGKFLVRLARADRLRAAAEERLAFTVSSGGERVHDLQPYLGAAGHLVVLRERDLSYLHAHAASPGHDSRGGPTLEFATRLPTPSRYRAFLQFRAGGKLRTVAFTVVARA